MTLTSHKTVKYEERRLKEVNGTEVSPDEVLSDNVYRYIICLTALDQEMDQVMGYEAGADDYITKPFSLSVLLLKIEAHLRRRQEKTEAGKMISGDIVFIAGEMKVLIKSREISLTKTELKMLTFFLQNPKQMLSLGEG